MEERIFRNQTIGSALAIILIVFFSFFSSLDNDFVNWDDESHLRHNPTVLTLTPQNLIQHFRETVHNTYIPLTTLSFALENHLFGLKPFVYHLDNLLLHLGVVILIYWFALQIGLPLLAAAAAAALFGIHPMHVESVAWITERKDVLYAFFYMLSVNYYWAYLNGSAKKRNYLLSLLFGLLSILSKAMALSLPLVLFVCDYLAGRRWDRKYFLDKIPYALFIIPIAWRTYSLYARVPGNGSMEGELTWIWTFAFYVIKFLAPFNVVPLYEAPHPVTLANGAYLFSAVVLLVFVILLFCLRKNRFFVFAMLFFFCSIFFLLRFDAQDTNIVADRFMYLPSLGFCLLFGKMVELIIQKKKILLFAPVIVVSMLAVKTFKQCDVWQNSITLWSDVVKHYPDNAYALANRADAFMDKGQFDLALADTNRAVSINPKEFMAYNNRGRAYTKLGSPDLAEADFTKAISLNPTFFLAYLNRGYLYEISKKYDLAIEDFNKALAMSPQNFLVLNNRGAVYGMKGEYDKALADFNEALTVNPQFVNGLVSRGAHYAIGNKYALALAALNRAIALDPQNPAAYYNRYQLYRKLGNEALATQDAKKVQELNFAIK